MDSFFNTPVASKSHLNSQEALHRVCLRRAVWLLSVPSLCLHCFSRGRWWAGQGTALWVPRDKGANSTVAGEGSRTQAGPEDGEKSQSSHGFWSEVGHVGKGVVKAHEEKTPSVGAVWGMLGDWRARWLWEAQISHSDGRNSGGWRETKPGREEAFGAGNDHSKETILILRSLRRPQRVFYWRIFNREQAHTLLYVVSSCQWFLPAEVPGLA